MTTIILELPDDLAQSLADQATKQGQTREEWVKSQLHELLSPSGSAASANDFQTAVEHVITKNSELYRRLA
jgi:hypothetical protein